MKKFYYSFLLFFVAFATSCHFSKYVETRAIPTDDARVYVKPLVAEVRVEENLRTWSVTMPKKEALLYGSKEKLCAYACFIATRNGNELGQASCDAIVAPTYVVKRTRSQFTIEISGYAAHYKSFKTLEQSDEEILKFNLDPFWNNFMLVPTVNESNAPLRIEVKNSK